MIKYIMTAFLGGILFLTKVGDLSHEMFTLSEVKSATNSPDESTYNGIIEGNHSVSLSGGFNYSVPIGLPPGINGIQPDLALSYNGQGGDGLAGYGWGVSGLSNITLQPSTKYHNGYIDPADFDSKDQYALDGQRLILKAGTSNEYQTEKYSNLKIIKDNDKFIVYHSGGSIAYYERIIGSIKAIEYVIVKWKDNNNNVIDYEYATNSNLVRISKIKYGHQEGGNVINEVNFHYSKRKNTWTRNFLTNQTFIRDNILDKIIVKSKGGLNFRTYDLIHDPVDENKVIKIKEYNSENVEKPSIDFEYSDKVSTTKVTNDIKFKEYNLAGVTGSFSGDFSGDGRSQSFMINEHEEAIVSWEREGSNKLYKFNLLEYNHTNLKKTLPTTYRNKTGEISNKAGLTLLSKPDDAFQSGGKPVKFSTYGIELNGKLIEKTLQNEKEVYFRHRRVFNGWGYSSDFIEISKEYLNGDFNGDGLSDIIAIEKSPWKSDLPEGADYMSAEAYFIDLANNHDKVNLGELEHSDRPLSFYESISKNEIKEYNLKTGDYNGDGKTDIFLFRGSDFWVYELNNSSNKLNLLTKSSTTLHINFNEDEFSVADVNGDGKSDIIYPVKNSTTWKVVYGTGSSSYVSGSPYDIKGNLKYEDYDDNYQYSYLYSDYNGDGIIDIVKLKRKISSKNGFDEVLTLDKVMDNTLNTAMRMITLEPGFSAKGTFKASIAGPDEVGKTRSIFEFYKGIQNTEHNLEFIKEDRLTKSVNNSVGGRDKNGYKKSELINFSTEGSSGSAQPLSFIGFLKYYGDKNKVNSLSTISFEKGDEKTYKLKAVRNNGNNEVVKIKYDDDNNDDKKVYEKSDKLFKYPFFNVNRAGEMNLVSSLEEYNDETFRRTQSFKYYGAVTHVEGLSFLGYQGVARSNWYTSDIDQTWEVSLFDVENRGLLKNKYTIVENDPNIDFTKVPSDAINETEYEYFTKLLSNPDSSHYGNTPEYLELKNNIKDATKIAMKMITLKPGFSTEGTFKASIAGQNEIGKSGYAGVFIGFPKSEISKDNLLGVTKSTSYVYDENWNAIKETTQHGNVGTTEKLLQYANNPNSKNDYYMARLLKLTEKSTAYSDSFSSSTEYSYDSKGRATRIIKRGNEGSDNLEENLTYDNFGNVITRSLKGTGDSARGEKFEYDTTGRFLTSKTNIEGQKATYSNNPSTGLLESETNELGMTTLYTYDTWNRPKTVTDYLGKTATSVDKGETDGSFWIEKSNPEATNSKIYFDKYGRVYREKTLSLNNEWISVDTEYDVLDRKIRQSEPYFSAGSPSLWNTTKYDKYGRVYEAIASTDRKMTTSYDGLKISVYDGVQTKIKVSDAMGNILSNKDEGGKITYSYFANGNMKSSSYAGNTITVEQDNLGRKTKLVDPSAGTYEYKYNSFGEIIEEIKPKGKSRTVYDQNGRVTRKTIEDNVDVDNPKEYSVEYVYDESTKLLQSVKANTDDVNSVSYEYDTNNFYQLKSVVEDNSRATYTTNYMYDDYGRKSIETYKAGSNSKGQNFESTIHYDYEKGSGLLYQVTDGSNTLYEIDALNNRGKVTSAKFGNGINVTNKYDKYGYLTSQIHDDPTTIGKVAMDYSYSFHKTRGNLTSRDNKALDDEYTEDFTYDYLDRLTNIKSTTVQSNMSYEDDGRIKTNSLVGEYKYPESGSIFQLDDIELNTEGKKLFEDRELQEAEFTSFKKPIHIKEKGNGEVSFEYNGGLTRSFAEIKSEDGEKHIVKHYNADQSTEIIEDKLTGKSKIVHYFGGPYGSSISYIAEYDESNNEEKAGFHYLHRDYLGSLVGISDQNGEILEKRHYGAWGKLEKFESTVDTTEDNMFIDRGWTGHEHIAQVSLVHMNGRMYDTDLGRFLAPDNYVQDPSNTQNYNRYQYAFNNPLKYTDPSGESLLGAIIVGVFMSGFTYTAQADTTGTWSWGGFIKSLIRGGISGASSFGIGAATNAIKKIASVGITLNIGGTVYTTVGQVTNAFTVAAFQTGAHAIVGGVMSILNGGSFSSGAVAGAVASIIAKGAMASTKYSTSFIKKAVTLGLGVVAGGVGSVLAGGSFMFGAAQGAITTALNHLSHDDPPVESALDRLRKLASVAQNGLTIENTLEAVMHYYFGNGEPVELDYWTKMAIKNSSEYDFVKGRLINGEAVNKSGRFGVNLTLDTFHAGSTIVDYYTYCSPATCTTRFNAFGGDGFWDPIDIGIELGGTGYDYKPYIFSIEYKNPGYDSKAYKMP